MIIFRWLFWYVCCVWRLLCLYNNDRRLRWLCKNQLEMVAMS